MKALFNSQLILENEFSPQLDDRAFRYGDGIFDTLIFRDGSLLFYDLHFARMSEGMKALSLNIPKYFQKEKIYHQIFNLIHQNGLTEARVKVQIWRQTGGLYTPATLEANVLVTVSAFSFSEKKFLPKAGFSEDINVNYSKISRFKTLNALPYVLAGIEKSNRGLDELIITNSAGYVAECTSSNIFWNKGGIWFTPPISSGCIAGIRRAFILEKMRLTGRAVQEILILEEELLSATCVCTANVIGVFPIGEIDGKVFSTAEVTELQSL